MHFFGGALGCEQMAAVLSIPLDVRDKNCVPGP